MTDAFRRLDEKLEAAGVLPVLAKPGEPGGPPLPSSPDLGAARVRTALASLTLDDAADPHPAWLVSARRPERVQAALAARTPA